MKISFIFALLFANVLSTPIFRDMETGSGEQPVMDMVNNLEKLIGQFQNRELSRTKRFSQAALCELCYARIRKHKKCSFGRSCGDIDV